MAEAASETVSQIQKDLVNGLLSFTVNFGQLLQENSPPETNILFSPFNLYTALILVHLGSDGNTRDEIAKVMGLPRDSKLVQEIHQHFSTIVKIIENSSSVEVEIAAGMFIQNGFQIKEKYIQQAKELYKSEVSNADFENEGHKTLDIINRWISDKTKGRIQNLFQQPFPSETVIILASSLYFAASWENQFNERNTRPKKFKLPSSKIKVQMMDKTKSVPYANIQSLKCEAISLPYENSDFSMFFVLPYQNHTLDMLVRQLTPENLRLLLDQVEWRYVHYKIPRTKFSRRQNVVSILQTLGVKDVFEVAADLTNMMPHRDGDIQVSDIIHATEIEVHEKGTVATAVTVVQMETVKKKIMFSPKKTPIKFFVNRPFLAIIYHRATGTVVFTAVVYKP